MNYMRTIGIFSALILFVLMLAACSIDVNLSGDKEKDETEEMQEGSKRNLVLKETVAEEIEGIEGDGKYYIIEDTNTGCLYIHYSYGYRMSMSPLYDETGTAVQGCKKNPNVEPKAVE